MQTSRFTKNDQGFTCVNCGIQVAPLGYTSRDHCPQCLCSLHIDINPGDRANDCRGILVPVAVTQNPKKGFVIHYRCAACGATHKNRAATDDNLDTLIKVMSNG